MTIERYIRTIPDFPSPGIQFRDVTTLFADKEGFALMLKGLEECAAATSFETIAAIDARGFVVGAALAAQLGRGLVLLRKSGKLPATVDSEPYALEYGTDVLELHSNSFKKGEGVLLVDDLIATGGTAAAGAKLIEGQGAHVAACLFIIDLFDLGGSALLRDKGYPVYSLCQFQGD